MLEFEKQIDAGESGTLELKRSTAQLTRAGETLCALLNAQGGKVVLGVAGDGAIVGQHMTDGGERLLGGVTP